MSRCPTPHELPSNQTPPPLSASDDGQDDSSDLDLDDAEYALKISEELGLGQITDVEKFASLPVLWPHPRNPKEAKGEPWSENLREQRSRTLRPSPGNVPQKCKTKSWSNYKPNYTNSPEGIDSEPLTCTRLPDPPPLLSTVRACQ